MIYRRYGKFQVSALGIGLFGPQCLTQDFKQQEYLDSIALAIELGVNYFDLGFPSCYRKSPGLVNECGKLLCQPGLITTMSVNIHAANTPDAFEDSIRRDLELYGLDHASILQLWGVNRITWQKILGTGILDRAGELMRRKLAEDLAFYYTDDRFYLKPILETGKFGGIALEYSFMEAGRNQNSFQTAEDFGLGVIVHGATKNGRLLNNIPAEIKAIWDGYQERTPAGWAFGLARESQQISCVLVETTMPAQTQEFAAYAGNIENERPGIRGLLLGKKIRDMYYARTRIQCEVCRCCMPCPLRIDAPRIAELYNEYLMYGDKDIPALLYKLERHEGSCCSRCFKCTKACPREYMIPDVVSEADRLFIRP